ncbi:hypothetical protein GLOTRDRAFT_139783 [Gloeophyllum trabeum ATCC 11539]|uniref:ABM domain-containing protein n=1 Tax=Gloeophyllum trabeum (strain ATCC 11539 / FP-39264 / Madison 617) TaxID=670483 RepID=S7RH74_GLOTA|nr:uncharacterized protein GLOTRDRAFT_139783 [Gloeophyllum trabeum ATCC 11539]EPQ53600.1 hypothetical protein GLOTRDRAFT_139783 [Gloeophyllum trabeum ATCC 11539]
MPLPVAELVTFTSTEAYQKDQSVLGGLLDLLSKAEGRISTFHGPEVEDPSRAYLFVLWHAIEQRIAFTNGPLAANREILKPAFGGPPEMVHVHFVQDPTPAFDAPVTEVAVITIKPGHTKEQVGPLLDQLTNFRTEGLTLSTWGPMVEREDTLYIAAGWESLEAHQKSYESASEEFMKVITAIRDRAELKITHGKLRKYD